MKCAYCGNDYIEGEDTCESCGGDLSSLDIDIEPQSELERALMKEPIASVPPPQALCLAPDTSLHDAVLKMNAKKIGCVLVVEGNDLVGIASERDILYKAFQGTGSDPKKITLEQIMTKSPESLHSSDTLSYAMNRMSLGGYRHIPIIEDNNILGLVSVQNILSYLTKCLKQVG